MSGTPVRPTGGEGAAANARDDAAIVIRAARREDVPRIWEMLRGLAEYEKMTDILADGPAGLEEALFGNGPRLDAQVAADGDRLVGYALFYPVFGSFRSRWRIWLEDLFVDPAARGRHVGERLLATVCRIARERGHYSVDWEVIDWNESALAFYRSHGAHDMGGGWLRYRIDGDAMARMAERA